MKGSRGEQFGAFDDPKTFRTRNNPPPRTHRFQQPGEEPYSVTMEERAFHGILALIIVLSPLSNQRQLGETCPAIKQGFCHRDYGTVE